MHIVSDLIQGILIGIVISVPLGPVGLITMKRTAEFGLRAGILSGLAIVIIDTIATLLILLGLHHTIPYIHRFPTWLHIIGTVIIFFYGLRMFFTDPVHTIVDELPWHRHFTSSAVIALTNPSTYFSFGIIGLLLARFIDKPLFARVVVGGGFFIGAFLWWTALAYIAFTHRDKYRDARSIHKIVGLIIMFLAIIALLPIHGFHL